MNYIREINGFYDWLETNHVSKSAIALWNALMHINNKTNWTQSFEVAISTLEFKTGFKRSELCDARNLLAQKGRITWKSRGGNLAATYTIIPFCVHDTDANADTNPDTNPTQTRTQTGTINKLNKTKLNNKKDIDKSISKKNFIPPKLEEVREYCLERKNSVDPDKFINFYEAKGWFVGKNKMKDWRAAVRTWENNESKYIHPAADYKQSNSKVDARF